MILTVIFVKPTLPGTSQDLRLGSPSLFESLLGPLQKFWWLPCFPRGESWLLWWYCRGGSGWWGTPGPPSCKGNWKWEARDIMKSQQLIIAVVLQNLHWATLPEPPSPSCKGNWKWEARVIMTWHLLALVCNVDLSNMCNTIIGTQINSHQIHMTIYIDIQFSSTGRR